MSIPSLVLAHDAASSTVFLFVRVSCTDKAWRPRRGHHNPVPQWTLLFHVKPPIAGLDATVRRNAPPDATSFRNPVLWGQDRSEKRRSNKAPPCSLVAAV
jgi:hypothetical protein